MKLKTTDQVMERAQSIADDLIEYAGDEDLDAEDLMLVVACTERIIQEACFCSEGASRNAKMTGYAVYDAHTKVLDQN